MWVKRKGKNGKTVRLYNYTKLRWAVEIEVEFPKIKESDIREYRKEGGKWDFQLYEYFSDKYYSLNITSLPDKGTLEFRLFNATDKPKEILERVEWVLKFVKDCMERD